MAQSPAPSATALTLDSAGNVYFAGTGIPGYSGDGTLTTIAGTGSGDSRPATDAGLNQPFCVQVGKAGNVYFSDLGNRAVRMLSPSNPAAP